MDIQHYNTSNMVMQSNCMTVQQYLTPHTSHTEVINDWEQHSRNYNLYILHTTQEDPVAKHKHRQMTEEVHALLEASIISASHEDIIIWLKCNYSELPSTTRTCSIVTTDQQQEEQLKSPSLHVETTSFQIIKLSSHIKTIT